MLILNIILIVAFLGFIGAGMKDGFVQTLGRLVGAVLGFIVARAWSISLASLFTSFLPYGWARFVAFLLLFVLVNRLVGFAFKLAEGAFHLISFIPFLKSINTLLGAIVGAVEGLILLGGAIWVLITLNLVPWLKVMLQASPVAQVIYKIFQFLLQALI